MRQPGVGVRDNPSGGPFFPFLHREAGEGVGAIPLDTTTNVRYTRDRPGYPVIRRTPGRHCLGPRSLSLPLANHRPASAYLDDRGGRPVHRPSRNAVFFGTSGAARPREATPTFSRQLP